MALSDYPSYSKHQVGDTVYYLSNSAIKSAVITKVVTSVTDSDGDDEGEQVDLYYLLGETSPFIVSQLYISKNQLLYNLKGDYLGTVLISDSHEFFESEDLSYMDLTSSVLEGTPDVGALRGSNLSSSTLSSLVFTGLDMRDTNLEGATLPETVDSKEEFKAVVGYYDPVTTIWTDGNPIGE